MAHTRILQLGNPLLKTVCTPVETPLTPPLAQMADDLLSTVRELHAAGLAAPQLGSTVRMVAISGNRTPGHPEAENVEPFILVNPAITWHSEETATDWEGCLSVPEIRGKVTRAVSVIAAYLDPMGSPHEERFDGPLARGVQHELDHLDGILFLDRIASVSDLISEAEYLKLMALDEKSG